MSKYPILRTCGLKELLTRNDWYNPSGNYWKVVRNGFLGGELLYDDKTEKVYGLTFKEIIEPNPEFIQQVKDDLLMQKAKSKMTLEQAKEIVNV